MRFVYLTDRMAHVPRLADAHFAEWGPLLPQWTKDEAIAELKSHRQRCALPTTLLLVDDTSSGEQLIGSVSLLVNDHDDIREWSPWLASLYVWPEFRGQGHGIALVQRCVAEARTLGLPRLYLYTAAQQAFYRKLGWRDTATMSFGGDPVSVMEIDP